MKKNILEIKPGVFPNLGYLEIKLPSKVLKFLDDAIKNKQEKKHNPNLAGNIGSSYLIPDKNDWFFNRVISPCILNYNKIFGSSEQKYLTKNCKYILHSMWVNYQQKYQFNPIHAHTGIFSFVIWYKIPSSLEEEKNLSFSKHSNSPSTSCFEFVYCNTMGRAATKGFPLSSKDEGTMLFFPSTFMHQVYPFYTSDKDRISIAGNVLVDPEQAFK
tara:strand:- start:1570 stop:2214 length:645 start_codon:yes stop_codon:yes gene_type:complete